MTAHFDKKKLIDRLIVPSDKTISLANDYDPAYKINDLAKEDANGLLQEAIAEMTELQDKLYAQDTYGVLILFQALDAAGKDGTIKHVMSGINPQGCDVHSFKTPSAEELNHDYLWRSAKVLPERGRISIFNRSYYEEVLVVRVHPDFLAQQKIPSKDQGKGFWKKRFEQINNFEKYLVDNGIIVLKFFLNLSKDEQKKRFLERINLPEKNWKFSVNDLKERAFWDDYMNAYEDLFNHTSTPWAPWYVIPANHKWVTHLSVGSVISEKLKSLNLAYPSVSEEFKQALLNAKKTLTEEK
ncbi:MAG: polyphosphate kinase 2 family protein [Microcystaceae cyanobacterium]